MVRYFIGFPTTGTGAFCWGKSWAGIGGQVEEGGRGGEWEGAKYFSRPTSRGPELAISRLQVFLEPLSLSLPTPPAKTHLTSGKPRWLRVAAQLLRDLQN